MESWQVFRYADKLLDKGFLQQLFTRSYPLIKGWAAGPTNEIRHRNPIDRITFMLQELDIVGRGDIARAAIDIIATPLGGRFSYFDKAMTDKGTVEGEAMDATIALGNLLNTIREALIDGNVDKKEKAKIIEAARHTKRQVDEILAAAEEQVLK